MNYDELNKKLKELKIEDYIWVIYIGIIFISWYSNSLERKYFIYNDLNSKSKYRKSLIIIFSILLVVYIYFLKNAIDDLNNIKAWYSNEKKKLIYLSFIGSLLITISGAIFLYIAYKDESIDVEIAFN